MSLIEETDMAKVNRLLKQHGRWYHASVYEVPCRPHILPFFNGWHPKTTVSESFVIRSLGRLE